MKQVTKIAVLFFFMMCMFSSSQERTCVDVVVCDAVPLVKEDSKPTSLDADTEWLLMPISWAVLMK